MTDLALVEVATLARFSPKFPLQNNSSLSKHPVTEKELQHKPRRVGRRWKEESKSFRLNKIALPGQGKKKKKKERAVNSHNFTDWL